MKEKNRNLKRFFLYVFKKNKLKIFISAMLIIVVMAFDLYLPILLKKIVDKGILGKDIDALSKFVILYLVMQLLSVFVEFILNYMYSIMRNSVAIKIRVNMLKHLSSLSGRYYTNKKTGNILSIVQSDMDKVESIDAELVFSLVKNIVTAVAALYFMVMLQYDLFLMVIVLQVVLVLLQRFFTKNIHDNISLIREEYGEITHVIQEYVLNIMNIVISRSRRFFISDYIKRDRSIINKKIKTDMLYSGNISVAISINSIITVLLYGYGGYKIINGNLTLGSLMAFQGYSSMLLGPCMSIVNANNRIQQARVSIDRVYGLLDEKSEVLECDNQIFLDKGSIKKIEFDNVIFSYVDESEKDSIVLNNTNLTFRRGEVCALVGRSGCGKSTIINLLFRLWDVDSGQILFDGVNIKDINLNSLRKNISVVTQDGLIFDTTIKENICLGKRIDSEKLNLICDKVGLREYISKLKDGIDTKIGERGLRISGGQKQRIAIARTIISDSEIIVLDEATSALDNESQKFIISNLKEYLKDKVVIVVAHRLSTIKDADNIYFLNNGRVVVEGKHEDLLVNSEEYRKLYYSE